MGGEGQLSVQEDGMALLTLGEHFLGGEGAGGTLLNPLMVFPSQIF